MNWSTSFVTFFLLHLLEQSVVQKFMLSKSLVQHNISGVNFRRGGRNKRRGNETKRQKEKQKQGKSVQFANCSCYMKFDEDLIPRQRTLLWSFENWNDLKRNWSPLVLVIGTQSILVRPIHCWVLYYRTLPYYRNSWIYSFTNYSTFEGLFSRIFLFKILEIN